MKKFEATIGTYLGIVETETGFCYQINPKSKRVVDGFVFGNYLYSFNESKRFYIIQREKDGFLKENEFYRIRPNVEYVLDVREKVNKFEAKDTYVFAKCRRR